MKRSAGATLVELLLVIGLLASLFGISALSLTNIESEGPLDVDASKIKVALLTAQTSTVNGNLAGVFFTGNKFVLFYAEDYHEDDPNNLATDLSPNVTLTTIDVPSQTVKFAKITGYPKNFVAPQSLILTEGSTGKTRTINLNRLGVVQIQ
jgi:Tfp pilus assembly protein FimT